MSAPVYSPHVPQAVTNGPAPPRDQPAPTVPRSWPPPATKRGHKPAQRHVTQAGRSATGNFTHARSLACASACSARPCGVCRGTRPPDPAGYHHRGDAGPATAYGRHASSWFNSDSGDPTVTSSSHKPTPAIGAAGRGTQVPRPVCFCARRFGCGVQAAERATLFRPTVLRQPPPHAVAWTNRVGFSMQPLLLPSRPWA